MFEVTPKGFFITFANGWTASVQFGLGNYCENRDGLHKHSATAEIAAWGGEKEVWHIFGRKKSDDCVRGWCKPDEVLKFLNMVSRKKAVL